MPKNKKPAGGRAQNFEPRYGKKTSYQDAKRRPGAASAGKPGSRSAGHRGHRPETDADATTAPAKKRWTSQEKAGRDAARGIRTHASGDRPRRDDRRTTPRPRRPCRPPRPRGWSEG